MGFAALCLLQLQKKIKISPRCLMEEGNNHLIAKRMRLTQKKPAIRKDGSIGNKAVLHAEQPSCTLTDSSLIRICDIFYQRYLRDGISVFQTKKASPLIVRAKVKLCPGSRLL